MNWISARCRRASGPLITAKRAPAILAAVSKSRRRAPAADFDVVVLVLAHWHRAMRHIGHAQQYFVEFVLQRGQPCLGLLELVAELRDGRHQRRTVRAAGLGLADGHR